MKLLVDILRVENTKLHQVNTKIFVYFKMVCDVTINQIICGHNHI